MVSGSTETNPISLLHFSQVNGGFFGTIFAGIFQSLLGVGDFLILDLLKSQP